MMQGRERVSGVAEEEDTSVRLNTEKGRERACGEAKDPSKYCYGVFIAPRGLL
jgi:hypothetical protein